jgi:hypothetical protein
MFGGHSNLLDLLLRDDSFNANLSFRKKCDPACRVLRKKYDSLIQFTLTGKLFGVGRETIRNHPKKYAADLNRIGSDGCPSALSQGEIDQIVAMIW